MRPKKPLVAIIIINYNGKYFLDECLGSVMKINFPKNNYEIIVVDNNSRDTSVEYIRINYPQIKIIESEENLGFAGGCNLGVANAKGKYIVFLNTDTKVEEGWLLSLVKRIKSDNHIAAVNSKILSYFPFFEISVKSDVYMRSEFTNSINFQPVGILLENIFLNNKSLQHLIRYEKGFYDKEKGSIPARWTKGDALVMLPCNPKHENINFTLTIRSEKSSSNLRTKILIKLGDKILIEDNLKSYEIKQYEVNLKTSEIKKYFIYAVQNSGVVVFKNGYGRDRGAVVKADRTCIYEVDNDYYNKTCDIISFCGASVLMRKDLFEKNGGFDQSFFMYYEDVDLSLKFKRSNWKIIYEPLSIIYHIHAGSSEEWSPLFIYNTEKNRLAILLKHFPLHIFFIEFIKYFFILGISILKMIKWRLKEHWDLFEEWEEKVKLRIKVIMWIIFNLIYFIKKRLIINKKSKVSMEKIYRSLY